MLILLLQQQKILINSDSQNDTNSLQLSFQEVIKEIKLVSLL